MAGRTLLQQALPITFGLKAAGWLAGVVDARRQLTAAPSGLAVQLGAPPARWPPRRRRAGGRGPLRRPGRPRPSRSCPGTPPASASSAVGRRPGHRGRHGGQDQPGRRPAHARRGGRGGGAGGRRAGRIVDACRTSATRSARRPCHAAARRARALLPVLFGALVAEHERDLGGWQAEWESLSELLALAGGAVARTAETVAGLEVDPAAMAANLAAHRRAAAVRTGRRRARRAARHRPGGRRGRRRRPPGGRPPRRPGRCSRRPGGGSRRRRRLSTPAARRLLPGGPAAAPGGPAAAPGGPAAAPGVAGRRPRATGAGFADELLADPRSPACSTAGHRRAARPGRLPRRQRHVDRPGAGGPRRHHRKTGDRRPTPGRRPLEGASVTVPTHRIDGPPGAPVLVLGQLPRHHRRPVGPPDAGAHRAVPGRALRAPGPRGHPDAAPGAVHHRRPRRATWSTCSTTWARPRPRCAGLSLGGMVAIWVAAHHPGRVDRLVLACTAARLPPPAAWAERAATCAPSAPAAARRAARAVVHRPASPTRIPQVGAAVAAMLGAADAEGYAGCCEAIGAMDQRADLPSVTAPTLVIAGADDPVTPPAMGWSWPPASPAPASSSCPAHPTWPTSSWPSRFTDGDGRPPRRRDLAERGERIRREVLGDAHVDARRRRSGDASRAPFTDFITRYAWGDIWTRPGPRPADPIGASPWPCSPPSAASTSWPCTSAAARRNGLSADEIARGPAAHRGLRRRPGGQQRRFAIAQRVLDSRTRRRRDR